jgi:hypothetical protein
VLAHGHRHVLFLGYMATPVQCEPAMEALAGLLNEFRHGNIVARSAEERGMRRHAGTLNNVRNQGPELIRPAPVQKDLL